jgi:hypothetical protein
MSELYKKFAKQQEFRENWRSDSHALFKGGNEFFPTVCIFLDRCGFNSVQDIPT